MSKGKRKVSASQRDKSVIEKAKKLKALGAISDRANLHSGRYVSRGVLKKVRELDYILENNYKPVRVPSAVLKAAKEEGYLVANNRVIAPNDRKFINRLKSGTVSGIVPVRGGALVKVRLPVNIKDLPSFFQMVREGKLDDYKLPGEEFAFAYHGHMSFRAFRDGDEFLRYFQKYESIERSFGAGRAKALTEEFEALELYKLRAGDYFPPSMEERRRASAIRRREARVAMGGDGRRPRPPKKRFGPTAKRYQEMNAARKREARAALKQASPEAYADYLLKERERIAKLRAKSKKD